MVSAKIHSYEPPLKIFSGKPALNALALLK